jgi:hypothetical protein
VGHLPFSPLVAPPAAAVASSKPKPKAHTAVARMAGKEVPKPKARAAVGRVASKKAAEVVEIDLPSSKPKARAAVGRVASKEVDVERPTTAPKPRAQVGRVPGKEVVEVVDVDVEPAAPSTPVEKEADMEKPEPLTAERVKNIRSSIGHYFMANHLTSSPVRLLPQSHPALSSSQQAARSQQQHSAPRTQQPAARSQ